MKKLTLITAATLILALASSSPSVATTTEQAPVEEPVHSSSFISFLIQFDKEQSLLQQQYAAFQAAEIRAAAISQRINELEKHVNKTWYVFSGITPDGWDCSGLIMWFYSDFQVELEHSVTAQMHSGEIVDEPMPGDIVAFKHNGSSMGYHNGLYIGNDLFIHSPRVGTRTKLTSVSEYAGKHSEIVFTRINF
jgi:cell wall-associated NlpC family hydrolase